MNVVSALALKFRFRWWAPLRCGRFSSFYDSHAQFGEDMLVRAIVGDRTHGTYVDIGAHHPVYYSNTYHFYRKGWRGLNVDALPGSKDVFDLLRPGDINLEACLAPTAGQSLTLYVFETSALTTTDGEEAQRLIGLGHRLVESRRMDCVTLVDCLERHLAGRPIDLLSIDVEGLDEAILQAHDWERFSPGVLVFERKGLALTEAARDGLIAFLVERGYTLEGKCGPSFVMRRSSPAVSDGSER